VARVLDEWGRVDVVVNNAVHTGPGSMERFLDLDLDMVATKLEANVVAQLVLIKAVLPGMLERGEGTIIDITSAVATTDPPAPTGEGGWGLGYAVTKGAFHRVAGILAVELGPQGLFVVNVEPGYVLTERMLLAQQRLGLAGRFPGAPPSVPGAVVAWLAGGADGITAEERTAFNGTTVSAQRFARERALHPDWRGRS
jgi:NAD(P)-dependent dehydrogenase (short-subunit alcohol dehydrogenase family)